MKKLLAFVVVLMAVSVFAKEAAAVTFSGEGVTANTVTYVNGEGIEVTENIVVGKEYPTAAVVSFNGAGSITVTLGSFSTTVLGDTGAEFSTLGSDLVSGIVVVAVGPYNLTGDGELIVSGEGGGANPTKRYPTPTPTKPADAPPPSSGSGSEPVDTY